MSNTDVQQITVQTEVLLQETLLRNKEAEKFSSNRILVLAQTVRNQQKQIKELETELADLKAKYEPTNNEEESADSIEPMIMDNSLEVREE